MWSRTIKGVNWLDGWPRPMVCGATLQGGRQENSSAISKLVKVDPLVYHKTCAICCKVGWFLIFHPNILSKSSCTGLKSCKAQPSKINKLILDWCRLGDAGVRCVCNALAHHVRHLAPEQSKKCGQKEGSHEGVKELPLKPSVRRTPIWLVTDFSSDFPHSHWRWIKKDLRL